MGLAPSSSQAPHNVDRISDSPHPGSAFVPTRGRLTYPTCGAARMPPVSLTTIIGGCPRLCSRGARTPEPATLRQPVDDDPTESPQSALTPASSARSPV